MYKQPNAEPAAQKAAKSGPVFTLKPSRTACMVLGGLMGLVIAGGVGLYLWQTNEIAEVRGLVKQKNEEVATGEQIARQLTQLENEFGEMQNQLRFLEKSVEQKQYAPTMLKQLDAEAKQVNLTVISIRPLFEKAPEPKKDPKVTGAAGATGPPPGTDPNAPDPNKPKTPPPPPYDKLHMDVEIVGTYWNVARFIYRLTEFQKIVSVDQLSISPKNTGTGGKYDPSLSVKMKLTGFIFPEATPKPGGPGAAPGAAPAAQPGAAPPGTTPPPSVTQTQARIGGA